MKTFNYTIQDPVGVHARPASKLTQLLSGYKSKVTIVFEGKEGNAKSMVNLMSLGIKAGSNIQFVIDGEDEDVVLKDLPEILNREKF